MARNLDTSHPILQLSERFQEQEYLDENGMKSDYHKYQSRSSCNDYRKKKGRNPKNLHVINTNVYNTLKTIMPHKSQDNNSLIVLKTEQPEPEGHFSKQTKNTQYRKHFSGSEKKKSKRQRDRTVRYVQASDSYRWYREDHKIPEPPLREEAETFDDVSDAPLEDGEFEEVEVAPIFCTTKEFKVPVGCRKYKPLYLKYRQKFYKAKFYIIPNERIIVDCSVTQSTSNAEVDIVSEVEDDNDETSAHASGNTEENDIGSQQKLGENSQSHVGINSNFVDVKHAEICVTDDAKMSIDGQNTMMQSSEISKPVDRIYHCSLSPSVSSSNFYQGKSTIQIALDNWNSHLIGLEYILEVRKKLSGVSVKNYCCVLCEENIQDTSADSIIFHIVKYKHMVKYLEKHFPTCGYKYLENDGSNYSEILLQKCCEEINCVCGYSYMCITNCDYYKNHMKEIKDTINKCKHFSEDDCHLNINDHEKILECSIYNEVTNLVNDICKSISDGYKIDVYESSCHRTSPKNESAVSTPSDIVNNESKKKEGVNTVQTPPAWNSFLSNYKKLVEYEAKTFKSFTKRNNPHKEITEKKNVLPKAEKKTAVAEKKSKSMQNISSICVKSKFKNSKSLSAYLKQKYSRSKVRKMEYVNKAKVTEKGIAANKEFKSNHVSTEIKVLASDEKQKLPSDENQELPSGENQKLPSDENQKLPSDENQELLDENQELLLDENQELLSDINKVLPCDKNLVHAFDENKVLASGENEVLVSDASEVLDSNVNEVLASDENQEQDSSTDVEIIEIKEQCSEKNDKTSVKIIPDQKVIQKSSNSKSKGHAKSSIHSKHCPKRNLTKGSVSKSGSVTKKTVTKSSDLDNKSEKSKSLTKKSEKNKSKLEKNNVSEHHSHEVRSSHRKTNSPSKKKSPSKTEIKSKEDSSSKKLSRSPARKHSFQSQGRQIRKISRSPISRQKGSATRSVKSPISQRTRSPLRRSIRSPIRLHARTSARKHSRSPGKKFSRSPLRRFSRSPVRRVSRSPVRRVSRSPVRRVSRSPARRVSRSPARRVSRSPARRVSRSPARRVLRSPLRRVTRSPFRRVSRSPLRRVSRSPLRRVSRSPLRRQARSPLRRQSRSPLRRQSRSPRKYSVKRYSKSPNRRYSRSPCRTVQSQLRRRSRSPVRYSRSPLGRRSRSPVKRYSRSPVRQSRSSLIRHSRSPFRDSNILQRGHHSPVQKFSRGDFISVPHYEHKIYRSEHSAKFQDKLSPLSLESRFARALTDLDPISDEDESTYFSTVDKHDQPVNSKLLLSSQNVLAQILQKFSTTDMNSNDPSVQRLMQFMNAHSTEIQQLLDSHPNPNTSGSGTVHHHQNDLHAKSALQQYLLSNLAGNSTSQQSVSSYSTPLPSSAISFPSQSFHHDGGHSAISSSFNQSTYSSFPENQSHTPLNQFSLHHHSVPSKPQMQSEVMFNDLKARVNKLFGGNESVSKTEKEKSVAHLYAAEPVPAKWNLNHPNAPKFSATNSFNSPRNDSDFRSIPENTAVQEGVTRPLSKNSTNPGHFFSSGASQERLSKHKMPVPPPDAKVSFCDAPRSMSHRNIFPVVSVPGRMNFKSHNDNDAADIKVSLAQRLASVLVKVGMLDVPAPLIQEMLMKIGAFSSCPPQDISEAEIITILRKLRYVT